VSQTNREKYSNNFGAESNTLPVRGSPQALRVWFCTLAAAVCLFLIQCPGPTAAAERNASLLLNKQDESQVDRDVAELAAAAIAEKRFQDAVILYTQALRGDPTRIDCLLARGKALEMCNQADKALDDYKKALKVDPVNALAMVALAGGLEMNPGGEAHALMLYKKALSLTDDASSRQHIAFSIAVLERRIQDESASAVGCWNIGNRHLKMGKLDEAEAFFSKAVVLNPEFYQAYYSRALTRLKRDDSQGALYDLSSTIALCPSLRGCLVARGLVYESLGKLPEAMADMKRAANVDARDPAARYHLGRLQEKEGAYGEALSSYLEAMRWRPKADLRYSIKQRIAILARSVKPTTKSDPPPRPARPLW